LVIQLLLVVLELEEIQLLDRSQVLVVVQVVVVELAAMVVME